MWPFKRKPTIVPTSGTNTLPLPSEVQVPIAAGEGGLFTAGEGGEGVSPNGWNVHARIEQFHKLAPQVQGNVQQGVAMDEYDIGTGTASLKSYLRGQPNVSDEQYLWYARQSFIGWQMAALVAQHWLVAKACNMPARDAVRKGWRITSADGETIDRKAMQTLEALDKRTHVKQQLQEFLTMGRTFGVRIAIPNIDWGMQPNADKAYELPFNIDGVPENGFKGWIQVDPYWCAPVLNQRDASQPDAPHFYEPTWWVINGRKYHRSHLVIYRHGHLADFLKPAYQYGGIPLPQLIMERAYGAERTANEAPLLALTKRTVVYKTNMEKVMAKFELFQERVSMWAKYWTNFGVRVIDKDTDEHQQFDTALADLDALMMSQYQLVAAAAEVPSVKLLGTSAKGFNATGEYDESSYHEALESIQENDLAPFLARHYLLACKSKGLQLSIDVEWNPLDSMTKLEAAQVALTKAQTGAALVSSGTIDQYVEQRRLAREVGGDYSGIVEDVGSSDDTGY